MKEFETLFKAHKQGKISTLEVFEKLFTNDTSTDIRKENRQEHLEVPNTEFDFTYQLFVL